MAWTAPMTAVANTAFTAAQFNTYVRDNLLETAPAKATTAGSLIVSAGANQIAERIPARATDYTARTTASTSYTSLASPVSVTVSSGVQAIVFFTARISNNTAGQTGYVALEFEYEGSTSPAADVSSLQFTSASSNQAFQGSYATLSGIGYSAGINTITMKQRVSGGTGTFDNRILTVIPL